MITVNNQSEKALLSIDNDSGMLWRVNPGVPRRLHTESKAMNTPHDLKILFLACCIILLGACSANTLQTPSSPTYDGLELVPDTDFAMVYMLPGADLSDYEAYGLQRCEVAFKKNWLRSQNNARMDLSNRVTQKDVDNIKDALSADCDKYFRAALEGPPPYTLVDNFDDGEAVLILRPAIINLDISAPDVKSPGMQRSYTTRTGEMTLVLELLDGTTGEKLVRIVDRQRSTDTHYLQWSNSVTNQAEARRFLKRWAEKLRTGLDEVTAGGRVDQ